MHGAYPTEHRAPQQRASSPASPSHFHDATEPRRGTSTVPPMPQREVMRNDEIISTMIRRRGSRANCLLKIVTSGGVTWFSRVKDFVAPWRKDTSTAVLEARREAARLLEQQEDAHAYDTARMIRDEVIERVRLEDQAKQRELEARRKLEKIEAKLLSQEAGQVDGRKQPQTQISSGADSGDEEKLTYEERKRRMSSRREDLDKEEKELKRKMEELDKIRFAVFAEEEKLKQAKRYSNREESESPSKNGASHQDFVECLSPPTWEQQPPGASSGVVVETGGASPRGFTTPDSSIINAGSTMSEKRGQVAEEAPEKLKGVIQEIFEQTVRNNMEEGETSIGSLQDFTRIAEQRDQYEKERAVLEAEQAQLMLRRIRLARLQKTTTALLEGMGRIDTPLCASLHGDTSEDEEATRNSEGNLYAVDEVWNLDWTLGSQAASTAGGGGSENHNPTDAGSTMRESQENKEMMMEMKVSENKSGGIKNRKARTTSQEKGRNDASKEAAHDNALNMHNEAAHDDESLPRKENNEHDESPSEEDHGDESLPRKENNEHDESPSEEDHGDESLPRKENNEHDESLPRKENNEHDESPSKEDHGDEHNGGGGRKGKGKGKKGKKKNQGNIYRKGGK